MTTSEATTGYTSLPVEGKIELLSRLAHELTVVAREGYEVGGNGLTDPAFVRAINELQHRVTAQIVHIIGGGGSRYPDEVFMRMLFADDGLTRQDRIAAAFAKSMRWVDQPA